MVNVQELQALAKAKVQIRFFDGLVILAEVVDVQADQDHDQLGYKLLEILTAGRAIRTKLKPGRYYASDLRELDAVERVSR